MRHSRAFQRPAIVPRLSFGLVLMLAGCGGGGDPTSAPDPTPDPTPNPTPTPVSVAVSEGNGQLVAAGADVPVAPAVVVRDAQGAGVSGVAVQFTVTTGGGSITGAAAPLRSRYSL